MNALFERISALLARLARHQVARPWPYAIVSILVVVVALPLAMVRLSLNGDLTALLPRSMQSVKDLEQVQQRYGQPATLGVLVHSPDEKRNQAFVRALAPRIAKLTSFGVSSVDWNIADYNAFTSKHRYLYIGLADLKKLQELLGDRLDYEKQKQNPLFVDVNGGNDDLEKEIDRLRGVGKGPAEVTRYRDGFFASYPDYYGIFVRTNIGGGQQGRIEALTAAIDREVVAVRGELTEPLAGKPSDLTVDYGGGVMDMYAEQKALADSAVLATVLTLVLVGASILLFFRRWTSIPVLLIGIVPPIALTFGIASLLIDYLNASSAFLTAIVIGNGINPHIIWLGRYLEARRAGRSSEEATVAAHRGAWPGTLSASLGAAVAYSALIVTDFRAFRDFGIIGGLGMALCWFATFLVTPIVAERFEKWFPTQPMKEADHNVYGRIVAFIDFGAPRLIVVATLVLTAFSGRAIWQWAKTHPIEYDFRKLQSERKESHLTQVSDHLASCADAASGGYGIAVLAKTPDDMPAVRASLEKYAAEHPGTLGRIHTIDDLLPAEQAAKIPVLTVMRKQMLEARRFLKDESQRKELDAFLPPDPIVALTAKDLPELVTRPFSEVTGVRGTVMYVEQFPEANQFDGKYLTAWTAGVRAGRNRDGSQAAAFGAAPVVADLVDAISVSGPRSVAVSFVATFILLFFTFVGARNRAFTIGTHVVGVLWMVGCMALLKVKINFLNFIALPVTFGLCVDYGVNVMRRFVEEERAGKAPMEAIRAAIEHTGGAVILCSLTTMIGYLALFTSPNQAVNSFGLAMSLAEVTCLFSGVVVLPAALLVFLRLRAGKPTG
jgi:predicted RND superfamily exporter protein